MSLAKKRIILTVLSVILLILSVSVLSMYMAYADESLKNYADGTAYTNWHNVNDGQIIYNEAPEAHAMYLYMPKNETSGVYLGCGVYPHLEAGVQMTAQVDIEFHVRHKWLGTLWLVWADYEDSISYDDLFGKDYVTTGFNGPNHNAVEMLTIYTFYDAEYGRCVWTITAN